MTLLPYDGKGFSASYLSSRLCHLTPWPVAGHLASLAKSATIFEGKAEEKLDRLRAELAPLAARYDVVVANPPYMGSSSLNRWQGAWVKKRYPQQYRDLCTCFIERGFSLCGGDGASAMVTMQSWMFLGSYERMRVGLLKEHSILTMAHLGTRAFSAIGGEVVSTTATVFGSAVSDVPGAYLRLVDMGSEDEKRAKLLEALADPKCGWFYQRDASAFEAIPGSPIAYWASDSMFRAFNNLATLGEYATPRQGLATTNNNRFLRKWWEISQRNTNRECRSHSSALASGSKWFPIIRGGAFRKWFGVYDEVVDWSNNDTGMKSEVLRKYPYLSTPDFVIKNQSDYFKPAVTWSKISSGVISFRYAPAGMLFEVAGACMFADDGILCIAQALCNSSSALAALSLLAPTLNYEVGQIAIVPFAEFDERQSTEIIVKVKKLRQMSQDDINLCETSWDFGRHPLT